MNQVEVATGSNFPGSVTSKSWSWIHWRNFRRGSTFKLGSLSRPTADSQIFKQLHFPTNQALTSRVERSYLKVVQFSSTTPPQTPVMSSLNTLSAASDDRKSRLANLRNLKRKQPTDDTAEPESQNEPSPLGEKDLASLHLSGRNYDAETRGPKLGFDAAPSVGAGKQTLEEQAADIESEVKQQADDEEKADKGIDLFKLQPKKPNWDLKRDLERKLEVLNTRTDNAIARLVHERIKASQSKDTDATTSDAKPDTEGGNLDGIALVEGLRVREQENEAEERRERQEEEALAL